LRLIAQRGRVEIERYLYLKEEIEGLSSIPRSITYPL